MRQKGKEEKVEPTESRSGSRDLPAPSLYMRIVKGWV